jgi:hypothetical protein
MDLHSHMSLCGTLKNGLGPPAAFNPRTLKKCSLLRGSIYLGVDTVCDTFLLILS